jgi:hypothetical protein
MPIFVKTYDFMKWLLKHTIRFQAPTIFYGKSMEDALLEFNDLFPVNKSWGY